jgi:SPP1 family predicted phage head-tail adaptor
MSLMSALRITEVEHLRRVSSSDGQGGWTEDMSSLGTVWVRVRAATSAERQEARQDGRTITHVVYGDPADAIRRGDQLEISAGQVLEVLAVRNPSLLNHHTEMDCEERQAAQPAEEGS